MIDLPIQAALADIIGVERYETLVTGLDNYVNQPNAVKGAAKRPSDPEIEAIAFTVFSAASLKDVDLELDTIGMWGLLTLAARADVSVLDHLPEYRKTNPKVASIKRASARHRKLLAEEANAPAASAEQPGPDVPMKVSEVAKWLNSHPDVDPTLFSPAPGQRAAARRAALRALGSLATPEALRVLAQYAADSYSDADLGELHRAWGNFDRREFAATMFGPGAQYLTLGVCSTIEGIGGVPELRTLVVNFEKRVDLAPLAECPELENLDVNVIEDARFTNVEPLTRLPHLSMLKISGDTRNADLSLLADSPVSSLRISLEGAEGSFLLAMPRLRFVELSGARDAPSGGVETDEYDVRPVHPGLGQVVIDLVRAGVEVTLYKDESWVRPFADAVPEDVAVEIARGYVRLDRTD